VILLDTNVLLYAVGGEHPLRAVSAAIVAAVGETRIHAGITDITLAEFVHATARRNSRPEAVARSHHLLGWVTEVVVADPDVRRRALQLYADHDRLQINDALIAATSMLFQMPLVSADRAFDGIAGLRWFSPEAPEVLDPDLR
jgi:predicted nucleic acid-binding protein